MKRRFQELLKDALQFEGTEMSRTAITIICTLIFFSLVSCDLFKTRTPSEPSQKSSTFEPLTDPDLVLQNMINSFQDGDASDYARSFSGETFTFEASVNARNLYGAQLTSWNKEKEVDYFKNVINSIQKNLRVTLEFTQKSSSLFTDVCDITTFYKINVPHTTAGVVKAFRGQAQFHMVRNSQTSEWSIQRWLDNDIGSIATDSTWSDLKGAFTQ